MTNPTTSHSLAVRRLDMGLALLADGDAAAAVEALEAALAIDPDYAEAAFALGEALEAAGRRDDAVLAYRRCLALDPTDVMGATLRLTLAGAAPVPARAPAAYVRALFDEYSWRYDRALQEKLGYRAPELLRAAVERVLGSRATGLTVLDLGCGTGLAGLAFRDLAGHLEGIDLSPQMIQAAERRRVYDRLRIGDILTEPELGHFDVVVAGDVLPYVGELAPLFQAVHGALSPGGLFAFTAERVDDGVVLGRGHRFAHSPAAITAAAGSLIVLALDPVSYRSESGRPVPGLIGVLRAP